MLLMTSATKYIVSDDQIIREFPKMQLRRIRKVPVLENLFRTEVKITHCRGMVLQLSLQMVGGLNSSSTKTHQLTRIFLQLPSSSSPPAKKKARVKQASCRLTHTDLSFLSRRRHKPDSSCSPKKVCLLPTNVPGTATVPVRMSAGIIAAQPIYEHYGVSSKEG